MASTFLSIVAVLASIAGVAFFAGSETSFVSSNRFHIRSMARRRARGAEIARRLMGDPAMLLSVTLVGTNICVVLASSLATTLLHAAFGSYAVIISTVGVTLLILFFGEIIPKAIARADPESFLAGAAPGLGIAYLVLYPVARAASLLASVFVRRPTGERTTGVTRDEIRALVKEAAQSGHGYTTQGYAHRVFDLSRMKVTAVMVPMDEVVCLDEKAKVSDAITAAARSGHSRYPVYRKSADNITGVLHLKHLLGAPGDSPIRVFTQSAHFVPETKTVKAAIGEMRGELRHLAMVTDEYGRPLGVVTFEDLVEEIMGEISDEYDQDEERRVAGGRIISGSTPIGVVNEELDAHIPEGAYDTLAGFVLHKAGTVPEVGATFEFGDFRFRVVEVKGKRISRIRVSRREADGK
jgi:putative hemolysin